MHEENDKNWWVIEGQVGLLFIFFLICTYVHSLKEANPSFLAITLKLATIFLDLAFTLLPTSEELT